jgi:dTDP-4-amino-4,6-dideoxygalactose transaminase
VAHTRRDLRVVRDQHAAGYQGGPWDGRLVGGIGRIGCFSFNGNKLITTGGGGMLVTNDPQVAARVRHLSTQARLPGRAYDHDEIGHNYRLSNLAAALGLAQLEELPLLLEARRSLASRYDLAIAEIAGLIKAAQASWANPSYWLYTAAIDSAVPRASRDHLLDTLAGRGIEARPIWTPLHRLKPYLHAPRLGGDVADGIFDRAISLPSSSSLGVDDQKRVIAGLRAAFDLAL